MNDDYHNQQTNNSLPSHNPHVGFFHHGSRQFKQQYNPYYLHHFRHNGTLPMMAHAPPNKNSLLFRSLIPVPSVLPLCVFSYTREETDQDWIDTNEWIMVEAENATNGTDLKKDF